MTDQEKIADLKLKLLDRDKALHEAGVLLSEILDQQTMDANERNERIASALAAIKGVGLSKNPDPNAIGMD